jgi:hypothetical protein
MELGIHKRRVSLTVHSQLKLPQPNGILLQLSLISSISLPLDLPNLRNVPLHCSQSIPFLHQGLSSVGNQESLCWELKVTHYQEKLPGKQQQHLFLQCNSHRISLFGPDNLALQYSTPKRSKDTPSCSKICSTFLV